MKLLTDEKKFFKANMHCHSTYSDGSLSVDEIKKAYQSRGYSIVAFTDHEHVIDNSRLSDENFLAITAAELTFKEDVTKSTLVDRQMKVCHINIYALDPHNDITPCYDARYDHYGNAEARSLIKFEKPYLRDYSVKAINEVIKIAGEKGFIVCYNHPTWSNEDASQYLGYENLFAVEIYNNGCKELGNDEKVFTDILTSGKKIFCTAADDNHNRFPFSSPYSDSFGGFIMINAEKLEYEEIMNALRQGNFYASNGPEIYSLETDGKNVKAKFAKCKKAVLLTKGRRTEKIYAGENEYIEECSFSLKESDVFFRLRITDENGNSAYTQPYFL